MSELIAEPWPWYVAGPLIGLTVPLLLWAGGEFGVSENLRHICAAVLQTQNDFFRYDWKAKGLWNLTFALGIVLGAALTGVLLPSPDPIIAISDATTADLEVIGLETFEGLAPAQVFQLERSGNRPGLCDDRLRRLPRWLQDSVRWRMHVGACHFGPGQGRPATPTSALLSSRESRPAHEAAHRRSTTSQSDPGPVQSNQAREKAFVRG